MGEVCPSCRGVVHKVQMLFSADAHFGRHKMEESPPGGRGQGRGHWRLPGGDSSILCRQSVHQQKKHLYFVDEKMKVVIAAYYLDKLLPKLVEDCEQLLPNGFIFHLVYQRAMGILNIKCDDHITITNSYV